MVDTYRIYLLWRGSDINAKKVPLAAWEMVCRPKKEGGLGVLQLSTQNDALLMKYLHKFYNRADLPWVHLVWDSYYNNGKLPGDKVVGSFWWRDVMKLNTQYKGIASVQPGNGHTIWFWQDMWNGQLPLHQYPELFSFVRKHNMSLRTVWEAPHLHELFHLPLSEQAFQQFDLLLAILEELDLQAGQDLWTYIWGTSTYSTSKAYEKMKGHVQVDPIFKWLWKTNVQPKHQVFFWLLLKDRINTGGMLRRRNMIILDSYTCELCILQREETLLHLFIRCNFARACWASIGITLPMYLSLIPLIRRLKVKLGGAFLPGYNHLNDLEHLENKK